MNERLGIIVDGPGDYSSLRKRFRAGFKIIKTDGPRGHTARPLAIAKKSRKQIGILAAFQCHRIIVLLDFEERTQPYEDFVRKLQDSFARESFPVPVSIVIPNKMIENWYLADIEFLSTKKAFLKSGAKQKHFEGRHGKNEIKRFMQQGESYSETKHGPQMFEILRFDEARKYSASLAEFLSQLGKGGMSAPPDASDGK